MTTTDDPAGRHAARPGAPAQVRRIPTPRAGLDAPTTPLAIPRARPTADAVTETIRLRTPAPTPPPVPGDEPASRLRRVAVAASALLAVLLVIDVVIGLSGGSLADDGGVASLVARIPILLLAAAAAVVAGAIHRGRAGPYPAVLAAAVLAETLWSWDGNAAPGALAGMLAVAVPLLLLLDDDSRRGPSDVPVRTLLVWWAGSSLAASVVVLSAGASAEEGPEPGMIPAGVLLMLLAVGATTGALARRSVPVVVAWVATAGWVLDLVALVLAGSWGELLVPVLVVHSAAALSAIWASTIVTPARRAGVRTATDSARRRLADAPRSWILGGATATVVLVGVVLVVSNPSALPTGGTGSTVVITVVGVLSLAMSVAPTMAVRWRVGTVAAGLGSFVVAWTGHDQFSDTMSVLDWYVLFPAVLLGGTTWGVLTNRRTGATSTRPGWVGDGPAPAHRALTFTPHPTARGRAGTSLEVDTVLDPATVLAAVRRATAVRGNWFDTYDDHVEVTGEQDGVLGLRIGGSCSFRARVETRGTRTSLRVGGLDRWQQDRWYLDFMIPISPAGVLGIRMYRVYLQTVAAEITRLDPAAVVRPS